MKVLVIDDFSVSRAVLKGILVEQCHLNEDEIHEAADGSEGVTRYRELKPDLVFLDINMPGMDGKQALREIISLNPKAKVVMCSSSYVFDDVQECLESGALDYMLKAPTPERVTKILHETMGKNYLSDFKLDKPK